MLTATLPTHSSSRPLQSSSDNSSASSRLNIGTSSASGFIPHIRIVPHLDSPRSLVFTVVERDLAEGTILKIGRFTDRNAMQTRITFKSKVVSRCHAELWAEGDKFYIRDTKSSSGTFLNHIRLSPPNHESRPFEIKDGDIVQLGVDYQGGTEEIYRCVKMRLEINRHQQPKRNTFTLNTFQSLRNLTMPLPHPVNRPDGPETPLDPSQVPDIQVEECCICLYAIAPCQALFVGPCSHSFHYKCIRPLLSNFPGFRCPLCRSYADLESSVAIETSEVVDMLTKRQVMAGHQDTNDSDRLRRLR